MTERHEPGKRKVKKIEQGATIEERDSEKKDLIAHFVTHTLPEMIAHYDSSEFFDMELKTIFENSTPKKDKKRILTPAEKIECGVLAIEQYVRTHPEDIHFMQEVLQHELRKSPNFIQELSMQQLILVGTQSTRDTQLPVMGAIITEEIIYHLEKYSNSGTGYLTEALIQSAQHMTVAEVLDLLDYLQTLAVKANASTVGKKARDLVGQIAEQLGSTRKEPLIHFFWNILKERIEQERKVASVDILVFPYHPKSARVEEYMDRWNRQDSIFKGAISFEPPLHEYDRVREIAPHTLGVFDHSGTLQRIAEYDADHLDPLPYHGITIQGLEEHVEELSRQPYLMNRILQVLQRIAPDIVERLNLHTPNDAGIEWKKMLHILNSFHEFQTERKNIEERLKENMYDQNEEESRQWMQQVLDTLPTIAEEVKVGEDNIAQLKKLFHQGFIEEVFVELGRIVHVQRIGVEYAGKKVSPEVEALIADYRRLKDNQDERRKNTNQMIEEQVSTLQQEKSSVIEEYIALSPVMKQQMKSIQSALQQVVHDLKQEREKRTQHVHTISLDTLVHSSKWNPYAQTADNETPLLLKHLYSPEAIQAIEQQFHISLTTLPFRAKIHFLRFLAHADESQIKRVHEVVSREGIDTNTVLGSFFALAQDPSIGDTLLQFAEDVKPQQVNTVTAQYNAMTKHVDTIEEQVGAFFQKRDQKPVDTKQVVREMVNRANRVLLDVIAHPEADAQERLQQVNTELMLFSSISAAALKGNPEIRFEDINGLTLEMKDAHQLSEDEIQRMTTILERNYAHKQYFIDQFRRFMQVMRSSEPGVHDVYLLKRQQEIISFLRVEHTQPNRIYIGGFNVNPDTRGSGIAEHMGFQVFQALHQQYDIDGHVFPEVPVGTYYVEQFGCVITAYQASATMREKGDNQFVMDWPREAQSWILRQKTAQALFKEQEQFGDPQQHIGEQYILASFNLQTQYEEYIQLSKMLLNEHGYRLTRYLCKDKECHTRLLGFEKPTTGALPTNIETSTSDIVQSQD